ncbi:MAG: RsmG family class I SAM-dependent methyltransferase [Spirochaetia bacterium]
MGGGGTAGDLGAMLAPALEALDIQASAGQLDALRRYLGELELWNRKRDLVKAEGEALITRHVADSLAGLPTVRRELERAAAAAAETAAAGGRGAVAQPPGKGAVFDLGSGGGFPGIPLSVFLPGTDVVLVERSGGKCSFLRSAAAVAGLSNVKVVNADFRNVGGLSHAAAAGAPPATPVPAPPAAGAPAPAVVTFRALSEIDRAFAGELARLLGPGGSVVAYKGRHDRAKAEAAVAGEVFDEVEIIPVEVPGLSEERTLLVLRLAAESS